MWSWSCLAELVIVTLYVQPSILLAARAPRLLRGAVERADATITGALSAELEISGCDVRHPLPDQQPPPLAGRRRY